MDSVLQVWLVMLKSWVRAPSKPPFTIEQKTIEGHMEDWPKCQIGALVEDRLIETNINQT